MRTLKGNHPGKMRAYNREGGRCIYCQRKLDYWEATLDHYYPKSKISKVYIPYNLVLSCTSCNNKKSNKLPLNFIQELIEDELCTSK